MTANPVGQTLDHPFFARLWSVMSAHESPVMRRLRIENLAGLAGRVLEVGAGTGTNFAFYPDTVTIAPVPVTVIASTIEAMGEVAAGDFEPFDAVVCSLVLCSVEFPETVLQQLGSLLKTGGELRYFEHVASPGWRGWMQRLADATVWPRIAANCHTHRDTERSIIGAGFAVETARHQRTFPAWVPLPVAEVAIGRASKA